MRGPITLAEWRKVEGISQKEMAGRLSAILGRPVHQPSIYQWENGVMPGADVAEAIRKMTAGKVTGSSFGRAKPAVADASAVEKQPT
jgi:transcriptional regulator with XRE-family HTH domain